MSERSDRSGQPSPATSDQLNAGINRLVEAFDPETVILFGSLVEGLERPESSVDMLVVASSVGPDRFLNRIKRAIEVTQEVLPNIAPLVYTPHELEVLRQQGDGFISDILDEGKVLYQKRPD